jgi:molybdate transport system substrate-binding protein
MVSAAVSLTETLEAVARSYAAAGGGAVRFNFAASNVLSRQIVSGARVDLFISADEAQMDFAARAGAIDPNTRIPLLANRLAIATLAGGPSVAHLRDLLQPAIRRIAVGDPAAVPVGVYAREYLQRAGLWEALRSRIVPVSNVRAALGALEKGAVEAAITYETDVIPGGRARTAFVVTGEHAPRILYPAAIVSTAPNRAGAQRLLSYLAGPAAAAVFTRHRFIPLRPGS